MDDITALKIYIGVAVGLSFMIGFTMRGIIFP